MEVISESPDDAPRTRSLRIRQTPVNYRENEDDDDEDNSNKSHSKEKKRASKRRAEVNIESLYCQENVKDVNPSLLETIFESPKKEQSRSRSVGSKINKNVHGLSADGQLMSLKKVRRFCSFSDYYHPSKQKVKARKDRAKKLKQLTGVKVPKGAVSNETLLTALATLSEEDDHSESSSSGLYKETLSDCDHVRGLSDDTSSFYVGNVIRPDVEDAVMNDVIKNISMMQVENELPDEKDLLSHTFSKDLEESSLFANENENPNLQHAQTRQRKSRRRSQKFSGSLLPPLCASHVKCEDEELAVDANIPESSDIGKLNSLASSDDKVLEDELMNTLSNTPKRRNVLNDQKVVKKTKRLESSLKRESEYNDEKCLKKRGNLKDKTGTFHEEGHNTGDSKWKEDFSIDDVHNESLDSQRSKMERLAVLNAQADVKINAHIKGRKRGKRRVSGVKRPLYRTILEPTTPEEEVDDVENCSPNLLDTQTLVSQAEGSSATLVFSEQKSSHISHSSTSPCSQMAALSLQSPDSIQQEKARRTRRKSERIRRNSEKLSMGSVDRLLTSSVPTSLALSPSESSAVLHSELDRNDQKVQKKKGRHLSSLFSQLELRTESKDQSTVKSVSCAVVEKGPLQSDLCSGYHCADPHPHVMLASSEGIQMINAFIDERDNNQSIASEGDCDSKVGSVPVFSRLTLNSEESVNNQCELKKISSCDDATHTSQHDQNISEKQVLDGAENSKTQIPYSNLNTALCSLEKNFELDSPVITGMFENKVGIRMGKIYHNQEAFSLNPIASDPCNYSQTKKDCEGNSQVRKPGLDSV